MLPENIIKFLQKVCEKVQGDNVNDLQYNSLNGYVSCSVKDNSIKVTRSFDEMKELNFYRVEITDSKGTNAVFLVYDGESGYTTSETLYDEVVSSQLELNMDD